MFEDGSAGWRNLDDPAVGPDATGVREDAIRMVRLPRGQKDCDAAATRSTWFGVIPTFSAEHYTVHCRSLPKLDDRAIYEATCLVTLKPKPGHEDCPPTVFYGTPSEAFRLASPMDPQGTSKRTTSITLPDLRRLAARAGQPMGPGGVQITTPPNSQLVFNPFKGRPDSGAGAIGAGGGVCTFALELFFLVAFFLFLMFLPIVVFAFQLWWMLALRFCIPPGASLSIVTQFFADGHVLADVKADAAVSAAFDLQFGTESSQLADHTDGWSTQLENAKDRSGNADLRQRQAVRQRPPGGHRRQPRRARPPATVGVDARRPPVPWHARLQCCQGPTCRYPQRAGLRGRMTVQRAPDLGSPDSSLGLSCRAHQREANRSGPIQRFRERW